MTNKFALPVFAVIAIIGAFTMSAFNNKTAGIETKSPVSQTETFFQFAGTPGQEEDETKWNQITEAAYDALTGCNKTNDGCRLTTTSTQMISSVLRPQLVEVTISGLHKNPKTSVASGVTEVGNANP
ncbi:MAG: hypothetical protein EOO05_11730 [Chitinophagaceae bacterium]|nr:MAG: hypothetical protein EOO05_11730 [Chitinophagaceae bacterium]